MKVLDVDLHGDDFVLRILMLDLEVAVCTIQWISCPIIKC